MANISLRNIAQKLGSNTVSGMAQDVGLTWPPPPPVSLRNLVSKAGTTALVLSGGGAKGSFEVGVLKYLYERQFRPRIICSTSVGSVNGLKLAEDEGGPFQGFQGLERLWLGLRFDSDMYVEDPWFQNTPDWIKQAISGAGSSPGWFQTLLLVLVPGLSAEKLKDLQDFFDTFKVAHGIYNLQPIHDLAMSNVNLQLLGKIRLRMATVGLQSGAVKYVTEMGRLVNDPASSSDDADSPKVDIFRGMLASAAIPVFFEAQNLAGDWYVDGGLRQVVPIQAAIAMKATEVYAVVAPIPLAPDSSYSNKGLIDIGTRAATDITIDEITTENIAPFGGWGVPVHIIRPTVEVEKSRTIDPGLIQINIDYGYMRAYDILSVADPSMQEALISLSDQIASKRMQIVAAENDAVQQIEYIREHHDGFFSPDIIRSLKSSLMGLVECRAGASSPDSMPPDADNWGTVWEKHQSPIELSSGFPRDPWGAYDFTATLGFPFGYFPAQTPHATLPPGGCPPPPSL